MLKKSFVKLSAFLWLVLLQCIANGQQSILSSGGVAAGSGGTVSYSVGQVFYKTATGSSGSVGGTRNASGNTTVQEGDYSLAEGVQQAFDIEEVTAVEGTDGITLQCSVYPNPVTDLLLLNVNDYPIKDLYYQIFDYSGRLIVKQRIENSQTNISMQERASAIYILKVLDSQNPKEIKTFKIIKN